MYLQSTWIANGVDLNREANRRRRGGTLCPLIIINQVGHVWGDKNQLQTVLAVGLYCASRVYYESQSLKKKKWMRVLIAILLIRWADSQTQTHLSTFTCNWVEFESAFGPSRGETGGQQRVNRGGYEIVTLCTRDSLVKSAWNEMRWSGNKWALRIETVMKRSARG